jgi:AcrR family transcriptional regulator
MTGKSSASEKTPRTARGERTRRAILDAAAAEFAESGFHVGSISGITRRAGVALGSFYTYFDSKDEVFRALVSDMSEQVRKHVAPRIADERSALEKERKALLAFLEFASEHREIYRIIDEAEFVDAEAYRAHYETTAARILERLKEAEAKGEVHPGMDEVHAWAIMGINVFLGLRYGVWADGQDHARIASVANEMIARGLAPE